MPRRLLIVGFILIEWFLLAAELSGLWRYYAWAFLIFYLWTEAIHNRIPDLYPKRGLRIVFLFVLSYLPLFSVTKVVFYIRKYGFVFPPPTVIVPEGVINWLPHLISKFLN